MTLMPFLVGLPSPFTGGGLLLGGSAGPRPDAFVGLRSKRAPPGVSPLSASFQNIAGDEVGMCWLGR